MAHKILVFFIVLTLWLSLFTSSVRANMVINEFSSFSSDDWVEIYANEDTDISGWILRDSAASVVKTIGSGVSVGPSTKQYYVIDAGSRLNKDGDDIKLFKPDDSTLVDEVVYGESSPICVPNDGQSIGRSPDGSGSFVRFVSATKTTSNDGPIDPCPTPSPSPTDKPQPTPTKTPTPQPTNTKTPTPVSVKTTSPTPIEKSTSPTLQAIATDSASPLVVADVLGIEKTPDLVSVSPESTKSGLMNNKSSVIAIFLVGLGILLIGISGYLTIKTAKTSKPKNDI